MRADIAKVILAAVTCAALCGAVVAVGLGALSYAAEPSDHGDIGKYGARVVLYAGIGGLLVGALAGIASYLPPSGFPFPWCLATIAASAILVLAQTQPTSKLDDPHGDYGSAAAAGVVTTILLVLIAFARRPTHVGLRDAQEPR